MRLLLQPQEQNDPSPFVIWLPIGAGLLAVAVVSFGLCPVPQSGTITGPMAWFLAFAYVALGVVAAVLAASSIAIARQIPRTSVRPLLPLLCSVAAWIPSTVAFYRRDSLWAATSACVLAVLGARLIYRHRLASARKSMVFPSIDAEAEPSCNRRPLLLKFAALLFQISALFALASMARPAALLAGAAVIIVSFCYLHATAWRPIRSRYQKPAHTTMAVALAIIFVAASLVPYLAFEDDHGSSHPAGRNSEFSPARASRRSDPSSLRESLQSLFVAPAAGHPRGEAHEEQSTGSFNAAPYPVLQALFGERKPAAESESGVIEKTRKYGKSTALVSGESYPGMILRPPTDDHTPIVPPLARRRVFEVKPSTRTDNPVSIPFYGAYWFFRASDGTLPADSIESRGDPAFISFKTTDFSPIAMEARQSFGSLIDLSCCRSLELIIANGDRRPGTVSAELILTNTRLPGKPQQSLGVCPVTSSLHWSADADRPPVTETLTFQIPPHPAISSFDQATVRFQMGSPRERWSAKVALVKFRLIPRGL
jgi:hypothetical protein